MMCLSFPPGFLCKPLAPYTIGTTISHVVETSTQNSVVKTMCKIAQLVPSCFLLFDLVSNRLYRTLLPPFVTSDGFFEKSRYAEFASNTIALSAGAALLLTPLVCKVLQIGAKELQWNTFGKVVSAFEKVLMTTIKTAHIGLIALLFLHACGGEALWIGVYGGLLFLNVWAAVRHVFPYKVGLHIEKANSFNT